MLTIPHDAHNTNLTTLSSMTDNQTNKWIKGLDSLRIILALIVLLGHMHITQALPENDSLPIKLLRLVMGNIFVGVAAVIAFFVISGIVIHLPYRNKAKVVNPINYLLKRYLRIGIPMVAVIIVAYICNLKLNIFPFWSLYCELFYYTLFPFLLLLIRKIGVNKVLLVSFLLSYILVALYSSAFSDLITQNKNYDGNYWQLGMLKTCILGLPCWLLGVKIAENLNNVQEKMTSKKNIYVIRLTLIFVAFCCSFARFHLSLSYLISLNLFAILAYYWITQEIAFWFHRKPVAVLENAGKWSYSLYLCHSLGIILVNHLIANKATSLYVLLLQLFTSLIIAFIFYLLIEKPSHQFIRKIKFNF